MGKVTLGEPEFDGVILDYNDEYSNKNFHDIDLSNRTNMNGIVIYSSLFYSEIPDTNVFPENMNGVKFVNCNLDNIIIPEGNVLQNCSNKRFKVQNDGNDWLIDENNKPIKPLHFFVFEKLNLPMPDPNDIPDERVSSFIDLIAVAKEKA